MPLVKRIAEHAKPRAIRVYTGDALAIPGNAHLAYYRDFDALVEDVRFARDLASIGLPAYDVAPSSAMAREVERQEIQAALDVLDVTPNGDDGFIVRAPMDNLFL